MTELLSVFATFAVGGPQVRYAAIANRFPDHFRHTIVAMDADTQARQRLSPEVDARFPELVVTKGRMLANRRRFRRFLCDARPDLLITHNWGAIEWAMANWPRVVRHVHIEDGFGPEERERQIPRRVLTRRLLLSRSLVVVPSRTLRRIATEVWRLPPARVRYIPNGIDLGRFPPRDRALHDAPVVGTVAALRSEKNLSRLIRAFAAVRGDTGARLVIVGDGPDRPALEAAAIKAGVGQHVRFTGHMADPLPALAGFDLFALSSDTEQMPISVIEAMAAALPLVATDVGDVRSMLAEANAPFVTVAEDQAFAAALATLLRDPARRAEIGARNHAKAIRDFDQETMFGEYADALYGIMTRPPPHHCRGNFPTLPSRRSAGSGPRSAIRAPGFLGYGSSASASCCAVASPRSMVSFS